MIIPYTNNIIVYYTFLTKPAYQFSIFASNRNPSWGYARLQWSGKASQSLWVRQGKVVHEGVNKGVAILWTFQVAVDCMCMFIISVYLYVTRIHEFRHTHTDSQIPSHLHPNEIRTDVDSWITHGDHQGCFWRFFFSRTSFSYANS